METKYQEKHHKTLQMKRETQKQVQKSLIRKYRDSFRRRGNVVKKKNTNTQNNHKFTTKMGKYKIPT